MGSRVLPTSSSVPAAACRREPELPRSAAGPRRPEDRGQRRACAPALPKALSCTAETKRDEGPSWPLAKPQAGKGERPFTKITSTPKKREGKEKRRKEKELKCHQRFKRSSWSWPGQVREGFPEAARPEEGGQAEGQGQALHVWAMQCRGPQCHSPQSGATWRNAQGARLCLDGSLTAAGATPTARALASHATGLSLPAQRLCAFYPVGPLQLTAQQVTELPPASKMHVPR